MMNEGPLGENDEKMMREKARTSGFISDFTRCIGLCVLSPLTALLFSVSAKLLFLGEAW
jgi:hypothetical protein